MSRKSNSEGLDVLKARMTRRKAVGTAAKVAGAAVAGLVVGGIVGYFAKPAAPAETVTVPTTIRELSLIHI